MTATTAAPWEPTTWLRTALLKRLALIDDLAPDVPEGTTVVLKLVESRAGERSDRTCDRCGTYVPPGGTYGVESISPPHRWDVLVIVGLCRSCGRREGWCS